MTEKYDASSCGARERCRAGEGLPETTFLQTSAEKQKPSVLLHACCGPCATACVERLAFDYQVTVFYYNPNITDQEEYILRRDTLLQFLEAFNREHRGETFVDYVEGSYDTDRYLKAAEPFREEPEGGRRCDVCFALRMEETARMADELAKEYFTTTLSVSPHKNYSKIADLGYRLAATHHSSYLDIDFKKKNGFGRSVELSKKYHLYRQRFCGCEYARRG